MLKHRHIVYFALVTLLLGTCMGINKAVYAAADSAGNVTMSKQYDLTDKVDYVEFTIEGEEGEFTASMTLPDGNVVKGAKSSKIGSAEAEKWVVTFAVNRPLLGRYSFQIQAPRSGYYNLSADVPLFRDIVHHWARADISDFVRRGIVNGYGNGTFRPDDGVTGEALVKMLVLAMTEEQPNGKRQWKREFRWRVLNEEIALVMGLKDYDFAAVSGKEWSKPFMAAASELGVMSGQVDYGKPFSRQDAALMMASVMELTTDREITPIAYSDTASLPQSVQDALSLVSSLAIFGGYPDGSFRPDKTVTRAEAVKMIKRLEAYLTS